MSTQDEFNWNDVEEDLVVPEQFAIVVYNNPRNDLVIRQAGRYGNDEDHFVVLHPSHALSLAKAILSKAGLDNLAIVHVSQLLVQNGAGELLQPFPDRATIEAVDRAGREDDDQDEDHPAEVKKDRTAAKRQRRHREKQRQRDGVGAERDISVTERDNERDSVTTAPALSELDLHGGEHQALTH